MAAIGHQFADRGGPLGGGVRDRAHLQRHFAGGTLHFCAAARSSISRAGRARLAHGLHEIAHGAGAVGILRSVLGVADGLLHAHRLPIDIEFFGHHQRQGRAAAGAHLGAVGGDHDLAVGLEAQIDAGLPGGGGRRPRPQGDWRPAPGRRRRRRCQGRRGGPTASISTRTPRRDASGRLRASGARSRTRSSERPAWPPRRAAAISVSGFPEQGSWCRRDSSWLISPPRRS